MRPARRPALRHRMEPTVKASVGGGAASVVARCVQAHSSGRPPLRDGPATNGRNSHERAVALIADDPRRAGRRLLGGRLDPARPRIADGVARRNCAGLVPGIRLRVYARAPVLRLHRRRQAGANDAAGPRTAERARQRPAGQRLRERRGDGRGRGLFPRHEAADLHADRRERRIRHGRPRGHHRRRRRQHDHRLPRRLDDAVLRNRSAGDAGQRPRVRLARQLLLERDAERRQGHRPRRRVQQAAPAARCR